MYSPITSICYNQKNLSIHIYSVHSYERCYQSLSINFLYYHYLTCPFSPYWQRSLFCLSFQKYAAKESLHFAATYWQPSGCIIVLANMYTAALWLLCDNQPAALWSFIPSGWDFPPFTQTSTSPIGSSPIPVVDVCHTSTKEESSCCIYYVYIYQGVYHWIILELYL